MGIYLNPGNEKFLRVISSEIYVDKTGMLANLNSVLETEQCYICVSRPRRFGKSITADMIAAYYDNSCNSKELFQNYVIAKEKDKFERFLNKYSVIQADMNDFRFRRDAESGNVISAKAAIRLFQKEIIKELIEEFPDAGIEAEYDLPLALVKVNKKYKEKFIIIIDEWDVFFREDKLDTAVQKEYIELFRGLFKNATSKNFIALAYITGILPIKKYGTQSALNNFDEFTMINPLVLSEYVGFTEGEVKTLCRQYKMDFDKVQSWYDGYSFRRVQHIYNPNSVVKAMFYGEFDSYWTRTETYELLRDYIIMDFDGLKEAVVQMLSGGRCKVNVHKFQNDMTSFQSKDDILVLLIHLGYLAYDFETKETYIPNEEILYEFQNAIEGAGWDTVIDAISASEHLLLDTWQGNEAAVANGIEEVHMANTSILSYNDENSLSCVITLAYYNALNEYTLIREMPAGKGYADIVFLPKKFSDKPAMIIELKYNKSAEGAITQMKERRYAKALENYRGKLLLGGINYDAGTKKHQCRIEQSYYSQPGFTHGD